MKLHQIPSLLVYGGSFDPPHRAHVELPRLVRDRLGLAAVAYIPAGRAPHKLGRDQTDPLHRFAMTRLAVADDPRSLVLPIEVEQAPAKPSYTADTLERLTAELPGDAKVRLLMGSDQMKTFETWRDPERISQLAEPVVMIRPPQTPGSVLDLVPESKRSAWASRLIEVPQLDISSTDVRDRIARGEPVDDLVPGLVLNYIREHRLYKAKLTS